MVVPVLTEDLQVSGSRDGFRFQILHYLERIPQFRIRQNRDCGIKPNPT